MSFEDKTLSCRDCQQSFTFTASEQEFFAVKKLENEPKRCPNCRVAMRLARAGHDPDKGAQVACHACETITFVPFKPTGAKPVYCAQCFHKVKQSQT